MQQDAVIVWSEYNFVFIQRVHATNPRSQFAEPERDNPSKQ